MASPDAAGQMRGHCKQRERKQKREKQAGVHARLKGTIAHTGRTGNIFLPKTVRLLN